MGEDDVVLVQQLGDNVEMSDLEKTAAQIEETLRVNGESTVVVGIGTVATHLRDLAKSYKEAQMAIEVGKVFDTEKYIISYENLGIGRLIEAKHYLMLVKAAILVVLIHHKRFSTVPPINIIR